jgi:hypothetical protein
VSNGLARVGQKEVVICVKRDAGESFDDYPISVLELFEMLYRLAEEGRIVDVGGFTGLTPESTGWFGKANLRGIVYTPPDCLPGVAIPSSSITAVLVTQNELDAAMQFGVVRFMALLGFRYRYFPTAPWVVRGRPDITSPAEMSSSMLAQTPRARVGDACAYLRGIETHREQHRPTGSLENSTVNFTRQEVVLELSAAAAAQFGHLLDQAGLDSPLALITSPDPNADACLVWVPGRPGMNAITSPVGTGARIAGNHVLLVPGQDHDEAGVLEDGFAILVTNATWQEIRGLCESAPQNWGMPVSGEMGFRLKVS